jgi:hypothetical protein
LRASGQFDARLNGALLLPTVPVQGEFETLLGHVGMTISVRMLKCVLTTKGGWGGEFRHLKNILKIKKNYKNCLKLKKFLTIKKI